MPRCFHLLSKQKTGENIAHELSDFQSSTIQINKQ